MKIHLSVHPFLQTHEANCTLNSGLIFRCLFVMLTSKLSVRSGCPTSSNSASKTNISVAKINQQSMQIPHLNNLIVCELFHTGRSCDASPGAGLLMMIPEKGPSATWCAAPSLTASCGRRSSRTTERSGAAPPHGIITRSDTERREMFTYKLFYAGTGRTRICMPGLGNHGEPESQAASILVSAGPGSLSGAANERRRKENRSGAFSCYSCARFNRTFFPKTFFRKVVLQGMQDRIGGETSSVSAEICPIEGRNCSGIMEFLRSRGART